MNNQNNEHYFLCGGGEMGAQIRAKDWSNTPLGDPQTWHQSLKTTIALMLDNPFGMYIAWGKEYIQLYNDGYRPILGTTKHPQALGISTRETFAEILPTIEPMFDGVMNGKAVGFPDFMLPLNRNGYIEECYFDFSYSPIRKENGEVGGVLVTVIETTNKKKAEKALIESEQRFRETIKQAPVGITILRGKDYIVEMANDAYLQLIDRKVSEFVGRPLFDTLPEAKESINAILDNILNSGDPFRANEVPIPINRFGKQEVFYFDFFYHPLKEIDGEISGILVTVTEVTEKVMAGKKIKENGKLLQSIFFNAPAAIAVIKGPQHTYVLANNEYENMVNRLSEQLLGKTSKAIFPELIGTGTFEIFDSIYQSGEPFSLAEYPVKLANNNDGLLKQMYFRFSAVPIKDVEGKFDSIVIVAVDITAQVSARKQIEESEQRFKNLVRDASAAIIVLTGPEMKVEIVNEAYGRLINLKPQELLSKPLFSLIPEAEGYFLPILENVRQTGEMIRLNDSPYAVTVNGKHIEGFLQVVYQPYRDTDGNIIGVMAIMQDVTESVLARKKIEQSEKKFEAAILAVQGIIWTNNANGEMVGEQQGWGKLTGQSFEEYQGYGWTNVVHPEDVQPTVEAWNIAVANRSTFEFEHRVNTKQDGFKLFSIKAVPVFDENDAIQQWVGVHTDITEKREAEQKIKESEERFRSLAQTLPQLVWITDAQGNLEFTSVRWKEYTGIEPEGEKEWKAVVHPDDYDNINAAWAHSLTTGDIYTFDVRLKNKNGTYIWHTVIGEPVFDNENNIVKWVGAFTDTHSEKLFTQELELKVKERTNELQQFNVELEKKNKELESFAYISSHDLQEPLRKIQTFATIILEKEYKALSENGKDKFKRMQDAAKRMQTLIEDLLVYSKTNSSEREFENIGLKKIIDEVKEDLSEELEKKRAIVEASDLCEVKMIPFQFRQLMHNLIGNALKFSVPNIPPHIKIKSEIALGGNFKNEKLNSQKKYCHITISDNGIGFDQQYSEKIFEVFQRLHGKNEYTGTGIGLSIVKKIVENHEGIITAKSEINKGATFDIYIPER